MLVKPDPMKFSTTCKNNNNLDFLPFQKRFVHDKRLEASARRFARDIPRDTGKACSLPPQASAVVTVRMHIVTEGY